MKKDTTGNAWITLSNQRSSARTVLLKNKGQIDSFVQKSALAPLELFKLQITCI
jgi:hypothetical protein